MHLRTFFSQYIFRIIPILVILFAGSFIYAQNKKSKLQADKKRIEKEIEYTNKLLESTQKSKSTSLSTLVLLNKKISQRQQLINTYENEIKELNQSIDNKNSEINTLNKELKLLKNEYAKMIYYAYKNRNTSERLMFIFSAESFNQAYQRIKYMQYYSTYRKNQAKQIEDTKDTLNKKIEELGLQKQEKTTLLASQESEISKLKNEKSQQQKTIKSLSRKEKDLRASLRKKRRETNRLNKAIQDIIAEEIRLAEAKRNAEKRKASIKMTEEEHELSGLFQDNKGKLPWPSEKGVISSTFGEHNHPVLKKIKIRNNGIDILTSRGEKARAVFDGTVISVRSITNTNRAVIIRHGEYFTVYSNLNSVSVRQGEKVKTKQEIGIINTDASSAKTELHFEIVMGKTKKHLNPIYWISKNK